MMNQYYDVVIVGAGPAGTAAAIYASSQNLSVALIESLATPKKRPGESLHPGVESIFHQLGIWNEISQLNILRQAGYYTKYKNEPLKFHRYGSDKTGTWYDMQIPRDQLDRILKKRAEELGVILFNHGHVKKVISTKEGLEGVSFQDKLIRGHYYIDATGSSHLFTRHLQIGMELYSEKIIAYYGYVKHISPDLTLPIYIKDEKGWRWYAEVEPDVFAWVQVGKGNDIFLKPAGGADMTWRMAKQVAGKSFFLIGDAACIVDPSSGKGVLRALMSGIMASYLINQIINQKITPGTAYSYYQKWLQTWFWFDINTLAGPAIKAKQPI